MSASTLFLLLLVLLAIVGIYFVTIYNRLQSLRNGAEATLSQIRVAMKKRLDMIEQLVDSVRSYAKFEKETLEKITSLRTNLGSANPDDLARINGASKGLVGSILAVAESYPQLKTSEPVVATMNAPSKTWRTRYPGTGTPTTTSSRSSIPCWIPCPPALSPLLQGCTKRIISTLRKTS
jgi:LemA protein